MTVTTSTITDQIEGIVESANERGIKVAGEWRNVSKFNPLELPDRGALVRVSLDAKAFIRSIEVLDGAPSASSQPNTNRDRDIARMCAIKVAGDLIGQFAQMREEVRTEHIFPLADRIYAWITQAEEGDDRAF